MLKKHTVVMLPTNQKAENSIVLDIVLNRLKLSNRSNSGNKLFDTNSYDDNYKFQHLYFLSDEEIKEGDWIYVYCSEAEVEEIQQVIKIYENTVYFKDNSSIDIVYCKKVLATTDDSIACVKDVLSIRQRKGLTNHYPTEKWILPQPSQSFIEKYVEKYNSGNTITDVMVEYYDSTEATEIEKSINWLKVNPKDNTITIKPVKDNWDREELNQEKSDFLDLFFTQNYNKLSNIGFTSQSIRKWIEENL